MINEVMPADWNRIHGWDFWSDYHQGKWEADTHAFIEEWVKPGTTYLDIGAWIGPTVKWAAPLASRVVAVEPDSVAFGCLEQNTGEWPNVERVNGAIADHTGQVLLLPHEKGFGASMSRMAAPHLPGATWQDFGEYVACWTLPDLWDVYNIENCSLVKMDIEGGESEILDVVAPFLLEQRVPLLLSLHEAWWSKPVGPELFDGWSELRGVWGGFNPILAIP